MPSDVWVVDSRASHREKDTGLLHFRAWAKGQSLQVVKERLQAPNWFAAAAFVDGMEHIAAHPGRTYLLDTLDHSTGLAALLPSYPQGDYGPGQRTISKGAWVIPMDPAASPRWVIP